MEQIEFEINEQDICIFKDSSIMSLSEIIKTFDKTTVYKLNTEKGERIIAFAETYTNSIDEITNNQDIEMTLDSLIAYIERNISKLTHGKLHNRIKEIFIPILLTYNLKASSIVEPEQLVH